MKKAGLKGILIILMAIGVTLFLNFDIYSVPFQIGGVAQLKNIQDLKNGEGFGLKREGAELFVVEQDPYVPGFILQGNYVVSGTSPEGRYIAYLYPDEWETIADIYLKDLKAGKWWRLDLDQEALGEMWEGSFSDGKYTPKKKLLWLNEEEFITIVGYAYGTVSKGGDLVKVNRETGQGEILYASQEFDQEVVDFVIEDQELVLKIHILDVSGFSIKQDTVRIPLPSGD